MCKYCGAEATYRQVICEPCFQMGRHHPWWVPLVAIVFVIVAAILFSFISGCQVTPYIDGGLGYSGRAGYIDHDETGLAGKVGVGVEFDDERWWTPSECGFEHRSMADVGGSAPEVITNDWMCSKRVRWK